MSDHYPCLVSYQLRNYDRNQAEIYLEKRKINESTISSICQDLLFKDWSPLYEMTVDSAYQFLINVIVNSLDKCAPRKTIKIRACDRFREPWMTVNIKRYNRKARKLCEKARTSKKEDDYRQYKSYRNVLNRIKLHEKRAHYVELFQKIGKNSKLMWNVINNIVRKHHNKTEITEIFYDGKTHTDKHDICQAFNDHFITAGLNVKKSISKSKSGKDLIAYVKKVENRLLFSPVNEQYICKIVDGLKSKSSTGIDEISNSLLKRLINVIKLPLCVIFNKSLTSGRFPDLMKIAEIIPLYNK